MVFIKKSINKMFCEKELFHSSFPQNKIVSVLKAHRNNWNCIGRPYPGFHFV